LLNSENKSTIGRRTGVVQSIDDWDVEQSALALPPERGRPRPQQRSNRCICSKSRMLLGPAAASFLHFCVWATRPQDALSLDERFLLPVM
jgi:hypothetical protein